MKSTSFAALCLTALLVSTPALYPCQESPDSWHSTFCKKTFFYPLVVVGGGYLLYTLYNTLFPSDHLDVSAPWHDENTRFSATTESDQANGLDSITSEKLKEIIETEIDLFCQTNGPQLVAAHALLADPNLDENVRKEVEYELAQLEQEAPPFAQSIPMLMVCQVGLQSAKLEVLEQLENRNIIRSAFDREYQPLLEIIDALTQAMQDFIDLYATACPNEIETLTAQLSGEVS